MAEPTELVGRWNYPTPMRFGVGRVSELPAACAELGMTRPLLVTDPGLAALPMIGEAVAACQQAKLAVAVFSELRPNPTGEDIDRGIEVYRRGGHDGVIAFGGGSAMDAAKAIALVAGQSRPLWDFEDVGDNFLRADPDAIAPVVAVPTTSGTGSEVGRSSVIVDQAAHVKRIIFHPRMLPARVICDPALTVGLPPALTGAVGMDALSHCLEAYCSPTFHPMAEGIAVEGMRLVGLALERAVNRGDDLRARAQMMAAAAMGATAFQKGLGAMHAIAHAVGGNFDLHHGATVACAMPYVLRHNRRAIEDKLERLARYLGLASGGFDAVLTWILRLREVAQIPHTLGALGIEASALERLAAQAAVDPTAGTNPLPLDPASLGQILQAAYEGRLS